jgi:preprotein translocase subunit SecY
MGVYPYITATNYPAAPDSDHPRVTEAHAGGSARRPALDGKMTYYLAVPMAMLSAIGQINTFNALIQQQSGQVVIPFGFTSELWLTSVTTLLVMTAGTMFAIWLGELISEYGIRGQGLSAGHFCRNRVANSFKLCCLVER